MAWICSNCSHSNEEDKTVCARCGTVRNLIASDVVDGVKGIIVFSDFDAWKESKKQFFAKKTAPKIVAKKRKTSDEPRIRTIKPPKEKTVKSKTSAKSFAKPWKEHKIKFDIGAIKERGYVKSEQQERSSVKGYVFYKKDGSSQFIRVEVLLIQKMAHKV